MSGLIRLVATALTTLGRPDWWVSSHLVRHSYVLGSCLIAFLACGMPRMVLCADDGAELRTNETSNDGPAVRIEDSRRITPRPPELPTLTANQVVDLDLVAGATPEPWSHPDVDLRFAVPGPLTPATNRLQVTLAEPLELAVGVGQESQSSGVTFADPRQAIPNPSQPATQGVALDGPRTNELTDDPVPAPQADPRATLPRPPIPSPASIAATKDVPLVDVKVADVEPEIAVVDSATADIEGEASLIPEENEDVGRDKDSAETPREPQLDVAAMIPSHTSGPVQLAHGEGHRVVAGPYYSEDGGNRELDDEMIRAVTTFIDRHVGRSGVADRLGFDVNYVRRNLLIGEAEEEVKRETYPPTRYMTAILKFDAEFLGELDSRWTTAIREARLRQVSFGTGGVLALLATVFGYLRLDTVTRGYYTGRLQLVATGVILALAGLGVLLARRIPWI